MKFITIRHALLGGLAALGSLCGQVANAATVNLNVTVENISPTGGVGITPVWVGFHSGNFDSYNSGAAAGRVTAGLEQLAEDGSLATLRADFSNGFTYVDSANMNNRVMATGSTTGRVDRVLGNASGPPPILPGQSVSDVFSVDDGGANRFFSYASMVLPSNDFFVANGSPTAFDLTSVFTGGGPLEILIGIPGSVNDAGTEVEDFNSSAANGLFGLAGGQTGPNQGADDPNAFVRNVAGDPFAGFANVPTGADLTRFNFNDSALYTGGGIARITISAVPEPSGLAVLLAGSALAIFRRRK